MNKTSLLIALAMVLPVTVFAATEITAPPKAEVRTANERPAANSANSANKEMMHKEMVRKEMMNKMDKTTKTGEIDKDQKAVQRN